MDKLEFAQLKRNFENWYDVTDEIEEYVYVDITVSDKYDNEWTYTDFDFIKIDGTWYIGFGDI